MALPVAFFIITCVIGYGIFHIVMWHLRRRHLYKLASKLGGPPVLPIIGNAHIFLGNCEHILTKLNDLSTSYPSPVRVWLGPRLLLFMSDPEQAKAVCLSPKTLEKGEEVRFGRPLAGTGLFTAPVSIWKVHRKLIQPTFNTKILDSFVETFAAQAKIFTEQIERNLDAPEFEIFNLVSLCNLDMICETTLGVKVEAQTKRHNSFVEAIETLFVIFCKRTFSPWLHPDFIYYRTKIGRDQQKYCKFVHDYTADVVKRKRENFLKHNSQSAPGESDDDTRDSTPRRKVFLDYLLSLPTDGAAGLSDKALRDEVNTMVAAGNDTSTIAGTYVMLMIASHPEVQEKVYQELREIYGDDDIEVRPVMAKDLTHMKYLERVIKETLRLFPALPFFDRLVTDDLQIGDVTLPKGSSALVGVLPLQRNEKYWPDPLKFDPDRFLPEEIAKRHPYAYMPFGAGPRNCIGLIYAMMSMKTLVSTTLRKYVLIKDNIVEVKDIRLKLECLLRTVDPIKMRIEKRIKNRCNHQPREETPSSLVG